MASSSCYHIKALTAFENCGQETVTLHFFCATTQFIFIVLIPRHFFLYLILPILNNKTNINRFAELFFLFCKWQPYVSLFNFVFNWKVEIT